MNNSFKVSKQVSKGYLSYIPSNVSEWHYANAYFRKSYFSGGQWDTVIQVRRLSQVNPGI